MESSRAAFRTWRHITFALLCCTLQFCSSGHASAAEPLPRLGADLTQTSVSGLSSGAFMTSQVYVALSDYMVGAGVIAGGPYLCAHSWAFNTLMVNAMTACMNPLVPSVGPNTAELVKMTQELAEKELIDPLENLKDDRIYLFSGQSDQVVTTVVVDQTEKFFLDVGVPREALFYNKWVDAGHAIATDDSEDIPCNLTKSPFVNDCDFEQAWELLRQLYGDLNSPAAAMSGEIVQFDQEEFLDSDYTSMDDIGYLYVPNECKTESCRLHIVLHGCLQGATIIGDKFYADTGYNSIADSNNFLVLYPQVHPSNGDPLNPEGCWDFWGYSSPNNPDPDHYSKNAPQIRAIHEMMKRLGESPS